MSNIRTIIEDKIAINKPSSETSLEEILLYISHNIDSWADKNVIWDLSHFNFSDISSENLQTFIEKSEAMAEKRRELKTAFVAKSDLNFGMMRIFSTMTEYKYTFSTKVFKRTSEAKKWINKENDNFKSCPNCGVFWRNREDFLNDKTISILGYQVNFERLTAGIFLFNHSCKGTFSLKVSSFTDLYNGPVFTKKATGSDDCPGHCLYKSMLDSCPAECECAFVREIIQIIKKWKSF